MKAMKVQTESEKRNLWGYGSDASAVDDQYFISVKLLNQPLMHQNRKY
jgi:hypothetical protein